MDFKRASGILLHPTSLPGDYGIGDLGSEAYKFVDFLKSTGQKLWQTLPLGPTGYGNSPYACYSAFAGNIFLISPDLLLEDGYLDEEDLADKPEFSSDKVEYGKIMEYKDTLYKKSFENLKNVFWSGSLCHFEILPQIFISSEKMLKMASISTEGILGVI